MTDKPILFSAPMIRALLEARKTQTRRVLKPKPEIWRNDDGEFGQATGLLWRDCSGPPCVVSGKPVCVSRPLSKMPLPYAPRQRLWVREAWQALCEFDHLPPRDIPPGSQIIYSADRPDAPWLSRKRHATFMPRWASRLTLIVEDVRVQRLQEISEADAMAEGVEPLHGGYFPYGICTFMTTVVDGREVPAQYCETATHSFKLLWNSIHGPGAWDANPWLAAITFSTIKANIDEVPR